MSQSSPAIAAGSGVAVRNAIANALAAFVSGHSGAARPAYAVDGTMWIKTVSASLWEINLVQGGADVVLATFDPTTGALASRALSANVAASVEAFRYDSATGIFSLAGDVDTGFTRSATNELAFVTAGVSRLILDPNGNLVPGANGLATDAASGFLWIESGAGAPTGVPSPSYSNRVPLYYDRTNNRLYIYNGGWRSTPLA